MRISLRRLFLLLTLFTVVLALGAWAAKDALRERRLRKDLTALGFASVRVDTQRGRTHVTAVVHDPSRFASLAKYRDVDVGGWQIGIEGECDPEMLASLAVLKNLGCLHFHRCSIDTAEDLRPLRQLTGVQLLIFSHCQIDAQAIAEISFAPNLKEVAFYKNDVAAAAVSRLSAANPQFRVYHTDALSGATRKNSRPSAEEPSPHIAESGGNVKAASKSAP